MGGIHKFAAGLLIAAIGSIALVGCGGEDDESPSTAGATPTTAGATAPSGQEKFPADKTTSSDATKPDHGGNGSNSSPRADAEGGGGEGKSGDSQPSNEASVGDAPRFQTHSKSKVPSYGSEANDDERERAETALLTYLEASEEGDWTTACAYVSTGILDGLQQLAANSEELKGKSCPQILALLTKATSSEHPNPATAIASLRVQGASAFALFHGTDGVDYSMPMHTEGDEWKVTSLAPKPLA